MLLSPTLFNPLCWVLLLLPSLSRAAFTLPVTSGNDTSAVEQNNAGTWCFYPAPRSERSVLPGTECTGADADFRAVMSTHLRQGISISYYSAGLDRLGGPEFLVQSALGKLYLCLSGQATDGLYETSCEVSTHDNQFGVGPYGNRTVCSVNIAQDSVSDGCYAPGSPQNSTSGSNPSTNLDPGSGFLLAPLAVSILATLVTILPL